MNTLKRYIQEWKYELLLFGLAQHLFIGILLTDLDVYTRIVWPINMLILGITSMGVFMGKGRWKNVAKNILFIIVLALPLSLSLQDDFPFFMIIVSMVYVVYFIFILWEVINFLIKPSYINLDIISAAGCGFFLLIELTVFVLSAMFYANHEAILGVDQSSAAATYIDLVYLSTITQTTIGFGDITPSAPNTKLVISLCGLIGHFYTVVLVGILISKFTSNSTHQNYLKK